MSLVPTKCDDLLTKAFSCTVASIARLVYAVEFLQVNIIGNYAINFNSTFLSTRAGRPHLTRDLANVVNIIMWSGIEASASTLCANLPCYGTLLASPKKITSLFRSKDPSYNRSGSSKPYKKPFGQGSSSQEGIFAPPGTGLRTNIVGTNTSDLDPDIEMNQVQVRTTISASSDRLSSE